MVNRKQLYINFVSCNLNDPVNPAPDVRKATTLDSANKEDVWCTWQTDIGHDISVLVSVHYLKIMSYSMYVIVLL